MIFKIFTAVVFIAELIIAYTVVTRLLAADKAILNAADTIEKVNPSVKEIGCLVKNISEQFVEFSDDFVEKVNDKKDDTVLKLLNKILIMVLLLKINSKFLNKLRRSRVIKQISRGLSLLQYVV